MCESTFAFGDNVVDGVGCPADQAGVSVDGPVLQVVERYDDELRNGTGEDEGTVPKEVAEESWRYAIQTIRNDLEHSDDPDEREWFNSCVAEGEEIASLVF